MNFQKHSKYLEKDFSFFPHCAYSVLGDTLMEFKEAERKLKKIQQVYYYNSALAGTLYEDDTEEIATYDEE